MAIRHQYHFRFSTEWGVCETFMDDLLLFTSDMKSHKGKLEDVQKPLLKNGLKFCQTSANYLRNSCIIWAISHSEKKRYVLNP